MFLGPTRRLLQILPSAHGRLESLEVQAWGKCGQTVTLLLPSFIWRLRSRLILNKRGLHCLLAPMETTFSKGRRRETALMHVYLHTCP